MAVLHGDFVLYSSENPIKFCRCDAREIIFVGTISGHFCSVAEVVGRTLCQTFVLSITLTINGWIPVNVCDSLS